MKVIIICIVLFALTYNVNGCDNGEIRLRGGKKDTEGRVEVCGQGNWGTVCDDYWDANDAKVACRQLGFSTKGAIAYSNAHFGAGTGKILLDDVKCTGSEDTLFDCPHAAHHNCRHTEDAGVSCQEEEPFKLEDLFASLLDKNPRTSREYNAAEWPKNNLREIIRSGLSYLYRRESKK
jgi:hypothetical protein